MRFVPEGATVKRALSAHAAIGLLAGALLYIVCLSGTLLVFYEEWQGFEQATPPQMTGIDPDAVQQGIAAVMETERGKPATTHLYVDMPVEELPTTRIITDTQAVHIDAQGEIAGPEEIQWSNFLYSLHYTLNIPLMEGMVGITLVGILGMLVLALGISGVIAHPKIFRDAFRLRARHSGGVALSDWHNRLSVWTLPFTLAIALTGAIIGLATVTATALATYHYDGDTEAFYATIFGEEGVPDPAPAPLPNVAAALRYMGQNYPDVRLTYVTVHEPGTAGQHVQVVAEHPRRLIFGEYYMFDAAGQFEGAAGLANGELGQQAAASNYYLHFGSYGGLPVKIAYALGGLALTVICATGVYIWLGKRRRRGLEEPRLYAAWSGIVWGAPVALSITLAVRLTLGSGAPFAVIFWMILLAVVVTLVARSWYACRTMEEPAAVRT
jgi:uncharacterized iron-regulated membrane protein